MGSTLIITIKTLFRTPAVLIWCLAFPVFLSGMFMMMFSELSSDGTLDPVAVAVVANDSWDGSDFAEVVDDLNKAGDDRLLKVTKVKSEAAGRALIEDGTVSGMYQVNKKGVPKVTLGADDRASDSTFGSLHGTILQNVADAFMQNRALVMDIAKKDPMALADTDAVKEAMASQVEIERFSATRSVPDEMVRYYYAMLAMAALLAGTQAACLSVCAAQPNSSILGVRRSIAGTSHAKQLLGLLLGSWLVAWACTIVAFLFVRFVVGIDFCGREWLCIAALGPATLCATALGAFIGALPVGGGADMRSGILIAVSMFLCMGAGVFGNFSMDLADSLVAACPAEAWLNPARLISDLFYSLYYYDSLDPFASRIVACVAIAVVLFLASTLFFRRQRYEHL
ncbi:MAG: ABC transporter permease [Eggerthellaceae bacterium]|jgi:ABC-2 type transport system permease protein